MKEKKILKQDRNCWRIVQARRAAFLIDGAAYFAAFRAAVEQAQQSILIIGWDIDSELSLVRDNTSPSELPVKLGDFLNAVLSRRHDLEAHILIWDFAMIFALERDLLPLYQLRWRSHRRLHLHMDDRHPVGACHHQKIVVVDDAVAFVGGFDLTKRRWDTPEHRAGDPRRLDPNRKAYSPFHDIQMMVDGEAAAALGELARERWRRATAKEIPPPSAIPYDPWPSGFKPDIEAVAIAIARTEPAYAGHPGVQEVEQLYLDAITAARHYLYIENEYLTAAIIGKALAGRLQEASGPEIVLVLPYKTHGWLEQTTMDVLRARLLIRLRNADRHKRLRVYYPDASALKGMRINVHSKVMIVDDRLVRIGSANLSNRSMGLDTECDLAIEANGEPRLERAIAGFRHRLLGEHLGVEPDIIAQALITKGSLIAAVESLRGGERTLQELDGTVPAALDRTVPDAAIIDPEQPMDPDKLTATFLPEKENKPPIGRQLVRISIMIALLGLAAAWRWTPLGEWLDTATIIRWIASIRDNPAGPVVVIASFLLASMVAFPITLLVVITALVFGPMSGFIYSLVGVNLGAMLSYGMGYALGRNTVHRLTGSRINRLSRQLAHRGLLTVLIVRNIPIAPFTVVNMVAGASHIRFQDYVLGTFLGMMPGLIALTVFAGSMYHTVQNPQPENFAWLGGVVALIAAAAWGIRHWIRRHSEDERPAAGGKA